MSVLEFIKVVILGIVEGITEWLPISSTGHMILVDEFIKMDMTTEFKDFFLVVIQLGAILAVVVLYWSKLWPFYIRQIPKKKKAQIARKNPFSRIVLTFVEKFCDKDKWIAVESFQILGDSTLKEAAPQQAPIENTAQTDANTSDAAAQPAADANTGDAAANGSTDAAATDGTANAAATDNSDSSGTATNSGGFTEEQLTNTDETRTLYRNSDGHPFVITPDGNGNWVDSDGNVYNFIDEQDAYDAEGNSYYWHGEAADVYYMPVQ